MPRYKLMHDSIVSSYMDHNGATLPWLAIVKLFHEAHASAVRHFGTKGPMFYRVVEA